MEHRIAILDDQKTGRVLLQQVLKNISPDVVIEVFDDPLAALQIFEKQPPDLLITDYSMPGAMNGIETLRRFRALPGCRSVPVIVITALQDRSVAHEALDAGCSDFLFRPINPHECIARCRNLLMLRHQQKQERKRLEMLKKEVLLAADSMRQREKEIILCLASAGEFKDECTGGHIQRIAHCSAIIAEAYGLSHDVVDLIRYAAPLHDIGKIGVPDAILLRNGSLSPEERKIMEKHTVIGESILLRSNSEYLRMAARIARHHHEHWNGNGYPDGLQGRDIPLEARIVAVADIIDALMSERPYKKPWPKERVFGYIEQQSGQQLDPDCVQAALDVRDRIESLYC